MRFFKNASNALFAFESDGSQDDLITDDLVEISSDKHAAMVESLKPQVTPEMILAQQKKERAYAYATESDPLFFKYQRGEIEKQVWLEKVAEIKKRYA